MANTSLQQAAINNGQTMNAEPAKYYNALVQNIKDETGIVILATEGTRTYARQKQLYDLYVAGKGNPAWSPESAYAYHLSGRAVDVGSGVGYVATEAAKAWRARAGKYGFRETVAGEPWHFEWRKEWVTIDLAAENVEQQEEDEDMNAPALIQRAGSQLAVVGVEGSGYVLIRDAAHYAEIANLYNATGVKLRTKNGLISWPAFKDLAGKYAALSAIGFDESIMFFTPKAGK